MARWSPADIVEKNEHIGRRLFDEPKLVGVRDQPSFSGLAVHQFEENRGVEYSLDRLGRTGLDRGVLAYLTPRANDHAGIFKKPKRFDGWVYAPARILAGAKEYPLPVSSSPVLEPGLKENLYHAHVCRPVELSPRMMALHLRQIFEDYGNKIHEVSRPPSTLQRVVEWMKDILAKVTNSLPI